jgi:hypothetical protein
MGKDKKEKSTKKEKKEAKLSADKVSKKDKKEKKEKKTKEVVERLYEELTGKKEEEPKKADESESEDEEMAVDAAGPTGGLELLPFAKPLMDEKLEKKALKAVKKGMFVIKLLLHLRLSVFLSPIRGKTSNANEDFSLQVRRLESSAEV